MNPIKVYFKHEAEKIHHESRYEPNMKRIRTKYESDPNQPRTQIPTKHEPDMNLDTNQTRTRTRTLTCA